MRLLRPTFALLILAVGVVSCTQSEPPQAEAPDSISVQSSEVAPQKSIVMAGMDLYMHDYLPTAGEARKPTFWVHAAEGELLEEEQVWALRETKAVIYRHGEEDLRLEADSGVFDEVNRVAHLLGRVRVHTASMDMEMAQIQWDNEASVAQSSEPLVLISGATRLYATGVILRPKDGTYELSQVSGRVAFEEKSL